MKYKCIQQSPLKRFSAGNACQHQGGRCMMLRPGTKRTSPCLCTCKADELAQVEGLELAQPEQAGGVDEADKEFALHAVRALQQILSMLAHEILDSLQFIQSTMSPHFFTGAHADSTRLCCQAERHTICEANTRVPWFIKRAGKQTCTKHLALLGSTRQQGAHLSEAWLDSVVLLLDEGSQLRVVDVHMIEVHNQGC